MLKTASWPRRILALFIDWAACSLVVIAIWGSDALAPGAIEAYYVHLVFVLESTLFNTLLGGSFGKLVTRLRVVRMDSHDQAIPEPVGILRGLVRSVLILLVIPPLVFRSNGRGLHDLVAGTATAPLNQD